MNEKNSNKMKYILNTIKNWIGCKKICSFQTFTYYIPAPPDRKTGYQEKQFDQTISKLLNQGLEIVSINTQAISTATQAGMWVLITFKATNAKTAKLLADNFLSIENDLGLGKESNQNSIEGLYHIES